MVSSSSSRRRSWLMALAVVSSIMLPDNYAGRPRASGRSPPQGGHHLPAQTLERPRRDLARHAGRAGNHGAEVEAQRGEPAEALAGDVRRARDRKPVDELVADAGRVGHAGARVVPHVVVLAQVAGRGRERRGQAREVTAREGGEAREAGRRAAHAVARDAQVVVDHGGDEGAVAERARVAAGRARCRAGVRQDRPEGGWVGADGEADRVGVPGGDLDDAWARRRDLDRDLRRLHALEPLEAAREAVAVDHLAAEVSLHGGEVALEGRDPVLALADALHRGVAATDAENGAAPALRLEGERGRRRHGRIARDRVRDAGAQADARGRLRRKHELAPDLWREVLAVGEEDGVEAELLQQARGPRRPPRFRHREDAHGQLRRAPEVWRSESTRL